MDILDKAVLLARTARVMTRLEAMKVENMVAMKAGRPVDYRAPDFDAMLQEEGMGEPVKDVTQAEKVDHEKVISRLENAVIAIIESVDEGGSVWTRDSKKVKAGVDGIFKALTEGEK